MLAVEVLYDGELNTPLYVGRAVCILAYMASTCCLRKDMYGIVFESCMGLLW